MLTWNRRDSTPLSAAPRAPVNHLKKARGEIWPIRSERRNNTHTHTKRNYQDEDIKIKIISQINQNCLNTHTHTHTHSHIYMYIYTWKYTEVGCWEGHHSEQLSFRSTVCLIFRHYGCPVASDGNDSEFLVFSGSIFSQLKDLCGKLIHDCCQVDGVYNQRGIDVRHEMSESRSFP